MLSDVSDCHEEVVRFADILGELIYFAEGNSRRFPEQVDFWRELQDMLKNELLCVANAHVTNRHH